MVKVPRLACGTVMVGGRGETNASSWPSLLSPHLGESAQVEQFKDRQESPCRMERCIQDRRKRRHER